MKNRDLGTGEMAKWLKKIVPLAEDLGSDLSIDVLAHIRLSLQFQGIEGLLLSP